jgi:hypothetical protein
VPPCVDRRADHRAEDANPPGQSFRALTRHALA